MKVLRTQLVWIGIATALFGIPTVTQDADSGEWKQAASDYTLEFPRDHASHPNYQIEWWYYTGNLRAIDGRRFGYQVTFFRVGVDRNPGNASKWAVRDLYLAHLAVTDIGSKQHLVAERLNRAGVGWAGANPETLEVWNEDWRVAMEGERHVIRALADHDAFGVELSLVPEKPPVAHGRAGFSRKGSQEGNASHYYSLSRLRTVGRVVVNGEPFDVEGISWMDHEFGTSFLEPSQMGWDWFSIQLDDGTDLMLYVIRQQDASNDPLSSGSLIDPSGERVPLSFAEYQLVPGRRWTSPTSGARYPVEWHIEVPGALLDLEVRAAVDAQEFHTEKSSGVIYWEGAITVKGSRGARPVAGRGYLEMTGYAGQPISELLR